MVGSELLSPFVNKTTDGESRPMMADIMEREAKRKCELHIVCHIETRLGLMCTNARTGAILLTLSGVLRPLLPPAARSPDRREAQPSVALQQLPSSYSCSTYGIHLGDFDITKAAFLFFFLDCVYSELGLD
mmetsp:Transcript_13756/g.35144  ORF Transcript_13756/g.35144 Transcript_13756/m.35144 type:complete len:131 (+) Transcript_13756:240-632(+)